MDSVSLFFLSLSGAVLLAGAGMLLWQKPARGVYVLLSVLVLGELVRIRVPGLDLELLLLDVLVLVCLSVWLLRRWWDDKDILLGKFFLPFTGFVLVALISLLFVFGRFPFSDWLTGVSYLIRLVAYTGIYLIVLNERVELIAFIKTLLAVTLLLAIIGFLQLWLVPDFTWMSQFGWDPHIGRLLSTWFDPNFLGGLFALVIILLTNLLFSPRKNSHLKAALATHTTWFQKLGGISRQKIVYFLCLVVLLLALYLTFSRSAYLMLAVGLLLTGLLRSPKILIVMAVLLVVFMVAVPRARDRIQDLYESTFAFATNSYDYTLDTTAQLRVQSWQEAWDIFFQSPLLGVGYNTLRDVKENSGLVTDPEIHSGSGADSSLLTILATTGLLGLIFYVWLLIQMFLTGITAFYSARDTAGKNFAAGMTIALAAFLVHSLFVNSLLLPAFLLILFGSWGLLEKYATSFRQERNEK